MITMHVHDHMVPVLQYEVAGEKPTTTKDVKKLSIMSCSNMCYTSSRYVVKIGKHPPVPCSSTTRRIWRWEPEIAIHTLFSSMATEMKGGSSLH